MELTIFYLILFTKIITIAYISLLLGERFKQASLQSDTRLPNHVGTIFFYQLKC